VLQSVLCHVTQMLKCFKFDISQEKFHDKKNENLFDFLIPYRVDVTYDYINYTSFSCCARSDVHAEANCAVEFIPQVYAVCFVVNLATMQAVNLYLLGKCDSFTASLPKTF